MENGAVRYGGEGGSILQTPSPLPEAVARKVIKWTRANLGLNPAVMRRLQIAALPGNPGPIDTGREDLCRDRVSGTVVTAAAG